MPELKCPPTYFTSKGGCFNGKAEELLNSGLGQKLEGKVQLIITSPPFPLNKKKKYGNLQGEEYVNWLIQFAPIFSKLLKEDGSIVIELGNAWESGRPVQSLLTLEALMNFVKHPEADLNLCQEFICHNPTRLPSPVQWVNIKRNRVTDSFTHVWWMAKSDFPKADNRRVLRPYSESMKKLQKKGIYNHGERPSGHKIGSKSFFNNNEGSIMPNVFEIDPINPGDEVRLPTNSFSLSNTKSNDYFQKECRRRNIKPHPARMHSGLINFFIHF